METTNETMVPVHYNPNQLVTYKVINNDVAEYPTEKVTDIEWNLQAGRKYLRDLTELRNTVSNLEEMLPGWIENDTDAAEIVSDICSLFNFNPTKDIEFEGTVTFSGIISVPLTDIADFDIDLINFDVDINSYDGDVSIQSVEVDNVTTL